eukprot:6464766-Amphidinium_carterae.1
MTPSTFCLGETVFSLQTNPTPKRNLVVGVKSVMRYFWFFSFGSCLSDVQLGALQCVSRCDAGCGRDA